MTATWLGHKFIIYSMTTKWNEVGGLYIFAGLERDLPGIDQWLAYYIGQTGDFSKRVPNHENLWQAQRLGATHVHALVERVETKRVAIERELIEKYRPPLNIKYGQ